MSVAALKQGVGTFVRPEFGTTWGGLSGGGWGRNRKARKPGKGGGVSAEAWPARRHAAYATMCASLGPAQPTRVVQRAPSDVFKLIDTCRKTPKELGRCRIGLWTDTQSVIYNWPKISASSVAMSTEFH